MVTSLMWYYLTLIYQMNPVSLRNYQLVFHQITTSFSFLFQLILILLYQILLTCILTIPKPTGSAWIHFLLTVTLHQSMVLIYLVLRYKLVTSSALHTFYMRIARNEISSVTRTHTCTLVHTCEDPCTRVATLACTYTHVIISLKSVHTCAAYVAIYTIRRSGKFRH